MSEINCNNCAIGDFKESLCKRCDKMKRLGSADDIEKLIIECLPSAQSDVRDTNVANIISLLSDMRSQYNCFNPDEEKCYRALSEAIKVLTAQPEIIRCKYCKHQVKEWREDKRFKDDGYWVYGCEVISDICGYWAWFGQDNEFCSEAERRNDG